MDVNVSQRLLLETWFQLMVLLGAGERKLGHWDVPLMGY